MTGTPFPSAWHRAARPWTALSDQAFLGVLAIVYLMLFKALPGGA